MEMHMEMEMRRQIDGGKIDIGRRRLKGDRDENIYM
jgi:hypothetical protein